MTRAELVVQGSECLQHIVTLAKKYSDTGDRDRCMILRSNALLTVTGLLELHRSVFEEGIIKTMEELLESKQKCGELLAHLANTARQTLEEDGQRIKDLITVLQFRLFRPVTDGWFSTTTVGMQRRMTLKRLSALSQPAVLRVPSYHFPRIISEPSTSALWNDS